MHLRHQENPSYFDEPSPIETSLSNNSIGIRNKSVRSRANKNRPPPSPAHHHSSYRQGRYRICSVPNIHPPPHASSVTSSLSISDIVEVEPECEVFLTEKTDGDDKSIPKCDKQHNSPLSRLTQFFRKSKLSSNGNKKKSIGSTTFGLRCRSVSSGLGLPPFTPDSSSGYTNSLDSDSHSSSNSHPSTNSDHGHYPDSHCHSPGIFTSTDGERYDVATISSLPIYYNQIPSSTRNHFRPGDFNFRHQRCVSDDTSPSYYNTDFQTFQQLPKIRPHSIANEANSPTAASGGQVPLSVFYQNVSPRHDDMVDGYLVPIQTNRVNDVTSKLPQRAQPQEKFYINETNKYGEEAYGERDSPNRVQVEVHTPTSSQDYSDMFCNSSASTAIPQSVYTYGSQGSRRPCSSDSSSTIEAVPTSGSDGMGIHSHEPVKRHSRIRRDCDENRVGCGLYCTICPLDTSSLALTCHSRKMNVAILSCDDCFFSERAVSHVKRIFETIVGSDGKKLNTTLHSFELRDVYEVCKTSDLHRAKIQIVIISNHFLDRLRHESTVDKIVSPINKILRHDRVIAILLSGVMNSYAGDGDESNEIFQQYLLAFSDWETVELKPAAKFDEEFYQKFTDKVMHIYTTQQGKLPSEFSIFPKKVIKSQAKVVIFFKTPLEPEDKVTVELKRGQRMELVNEVVLVNPYSGIIRLPDSVFNDRSSIFEIMLSINDQKLGCKLLKYDHKDCDAFVEIEQGETPPTSGESLASNIREAVVHSIGKAYYDEPRPTKQDYCIPPSARPIVPQKPKKIKRPDISVTSNIRYSQNYIQTPSEDERFTITSSELANVIRSIHLETLENNYVNGFSQINASNFFSGDLSPNHDLSNSDTARASSPTSSSDDI